MLLTFWLENLKGRKPRRRWDKTIFMPFRDEGAEWIELAEITLGL
jgi:hypothetical protein